MGLSSTVYCGGASAIAAFTLPCPCPGSATRPNGGPSLRGLGNGRGRGAGGLLTASAASPLHRMLFVQRVVACCTDGSDADACCPLS